VAVAEVCTLLGAILVRTVCATTLAMTRSAAEMTVTIYGNPIFYYKIVTEYNKHIKEKKTSTANFSNSCRPTWPWPSTTFSPKMMFSVARATWNIFSASELSTNIPSGITCPNGMNGPQTCGSNLYRPTRPCVDKKLSYRWQTARRTPRGQSRSPNDSICYVWFPIAALYSG